jgi:hypothetical protein
MHRPGPAPAGASAPGYLVNDFSSSTTCGCPPSEALVTISDFTGPTFGGPRREVGFDRALQPTVTLLPHD